MEVVYKQKLKLRIDWSDLDLFGHVNNVAFFKYAQASRLAYCELLDLTSTMEAGKLSFMVASSQCDFKLPLYYPGEIEVQTRLDWIKNTSFQLRHRILNQQGQIAAETSDVLVLYDYEKKEKTLIKADLKMKMEELEGRKL